MATAPLSPSHNFSFELKNYPDTDKIHKPQFMAAENVCSSSSPSQESLAPAAEPSSCMYDLESTDISYTESGTDLDGLLSSTAERLGGCADEELGSGEEELCASEEIDFDVGFSEAAQLLERGSRLYGESSATSTCAEGAHMESFDRVDSPRSSYERVGAEPSPASGADNPGEAGNHLEREFPFLHPSIITDSNASVLANLNSAGSSFLRAEAGAMSGFASASNKRISIDRSKLESCMGILYKNMPEMLGAHDSAALNSDADASLDGHAHKRPTEDSAMDVGFSSAGENASNKVKDGPSPCAGFVTGNNKRIKLSAEQYNKARELLQLGSEGDEETNKALPVIEEANKALPVIEEANKALPVIEEAEKEIATPRDTKLPPPCGAEQTPQPDSLPSRLVRSYNNPQTGHAAVELREKIQMAEIFRNVCTYFKKEEEDWIAIQFKWAWLHFAVNPPSSAGSLEAEIIENMNMRRMKEHSVLRRIAEFDDVPGRYMVLGILRLDEESVELYDGWYSVRALIDARTYAMLRAKRAGLGSRLHVFGAQRLTEEATSIFDLHAPLLRLSYNGVKMCHEPCCLGYRKKVAFLNSIVDIHPDGGPISAIIVRVVRVIETKYIITAGHYKKIVDDPERGLEEVHELAEKAGRTDLNVRTNRFTRLVVADASAECLVTWWCSPDRVVAGERYKMIYLKPTHDRLGLQLSTNNKSYIEKL
ncbi:hypothetical protein PAPHI01_1796 [Pancytospora philotis]|nr:hypothetical protein PAPHI01_1796 [Pancytospora philotis]